MNALETMLKEAEALGKSVGAPAGFSDALSPINDKALPDSVNLKADKNKTDKPDNTEPAAANNTVLGNVVTQADNSAALEKAEQQNAALRPLG